LWPTSKAKSEYQFERRQFGTTPEPLRLLSEWFVELQVEEVVTAVTRVQIRSGTPKSIEQPERTSLAKLTIYNVIEEREENMRKLFLFAIALTLWAGVAFMLLSAARQDS
jgi:hypothetical protein